MGLTSDDAVPACRHLFDAARKSENEDIVSLGPTDDEGESREDPAPVITATGATVNLEALPPRVAIALDVERPAAKPVPLATTEAAPQVPPTSVKVAPRAPAPAKKALVPTPAMTFPDLESTVITPILRFPVLNEAFTSADMKAWLDGANRKIAGCGWRRIFRFQRMKRVDYLVEFESAEAALKIRGLIHPKEGAIREGSFMGRPEFQQIVGNSRAAEEQTSNAAEISSAPAPYAGGRPDLKGFRYASLKVREITLGQDGLSLPSRLPPEHSPALRLPRDGGVAPLPDSVMHDETTRTDRCGQETRRKTGVLLRLVLQRGRSSGRVHHAFDHVRGRQLHDALSRLRASADVVLANGVDAIVVHLRRILPIPAPESARLRSARDDERGHHPRLLLGLGTVNLDLGAFETARDDGTIRGAVNGALWILLGRLRPVYSLELGKGRNRKKVKWRNRQLPYWAAWGSTFRVAWGILSLILSLRRLLGRDGANELERSVRCTWILAPAEHPSMPTSLGNKSPVSGDKIPHARVTGSSSHPSRSSSLLS
ncbi:hypothetical protein B0H13DRAFT_2310449 [Mycena leptocephala]|nr:hypothetical protein B0H13DRAFT_2310449 [Mycena leptocephala]